MLAASVDDEQVGTYPLLTYHGTSASMAGINWTANGIANKGDDVQAESELSEVKGQAKMIFRRLNRNSEQQASIESGPYTLQYVLCQGLFHITNIPVC